MLACKHGGQWYIIAVMSISPALLSAMIRFLFSLLLAGMLPALAQAELSIVTSIKPLELISRAIIGERGQVSALVDARQSAHHYTISPSDRITIARAELLVWIDPEFEVYLSGIFRDQSRTKPLITATALDGIALLRESSGAIDPHLWLDSNNALVMAAEIAIKAAELDPDNADYFQMNLAHFNREIASSDEIIAARLTRPAVYPYAIYHNAYRYFENRYNLSHGVVLLRNPEIQPNVQEIIAARKKVEELKPRCLFIEPDSNAAIIATMLAGQRLNQVVTDLLGDEIESDSRGYSRLIFSLSEQFEQCIY